jgi:release factor glutamine methyltransferase
MESKIENQKSKMEGPWTYGRLLDWTANFLAQRGSEFPRLDTEVLLSHTLGCKRIELYTRYDEPATEEERTRFKELIRKRLEGCPVAYLVGRKEFFSLEFEVGPAVLIPRPDTETLVVEALRLARELPEPNVVDIGTGSGAIAVALARQHKAAKVSATDISPEALAVAQRNAARHGVAERIRFLHGDLFEPIGAEERFDFILSNPPYIAREDLTKLPVGVRDYEPQLALDGGLGGYAVFDRLIHEAPRCLKPGGYLIVEIGAPQEGPTRQRLGAYPEYELGPTIKDGVGHPRVLRARWRG